MLGKMYLVDSKQIHGLLITGKPDAIALKREGLPFRPFEKIREHTRKILLIAPLPKIPIIKLPKNQRLIRIPIQQSKPIQLLILFRDLVLFMDCIRPQRGLFQGALILDCHSGLLFRLDFFCYDRVCRA